MTENEHEHKCMICLDVIRESYNLYSLECSHKYHTKCIIDWFRSGSKTCPLCNDIPKQSFMDAGLTQQRLKNIKKISMRKNAPQTIITDFKKLQTMIQQHKDMNKQYRDFKNTDDYKIIMKTSKKHRKKIFQFKKKIRTQEHKIISSYPILITY